MASPRQGGGPDQRAALQPGYARRRARPRTARGFRQGRSNPATIEITRPAPRRLTKLDRAVRRKCERSQRPIRGRLPDGGSRPAALNLILRVRRLLMRPSCRSPAVGVAIVLAVNRPARSCTICGGAVVASINRVWRIRIGWSPLARSHRRWVTMITAGGTPSARRASKRRLVLGNAADGCAASSPITAL